MKHNILVLALVLLLAPSVMAYNYSIVAGYDFNDSGNDYGTLYNWSVSGTPTFTAGIVGNAVTSFSGSNYYSAAGNSNWQQYFRPSSGGTIAFWMKANSGVGAIVSDRDCGFPCTNTQGVFQYEFNGNGTLRLTYGQAVGSFEQLNFGNLLFSNDEWQRVVMVHHTNGTTCGYRNGALVTCNTYAGTGYRNSTVYVGQDGFSGALNSNTKMDVVLIASKAWNSTLITDDYNAGAGHDAAYYYNTSEPSPPPSNVPPTVHQVTISTPNSTIPFNSSLPAQLSINLSDSDSSSFNITYALLRNGIFTTGGTVTGFTVEGMLTNVANATINLSGTYTLQANVTDGINVTSATSSGLVITQDGAPANIAPVIHQAFMSNPNATIPFNGTLPALLHVNLTDADSSSFNFTYALLRGGIFTTGGTVTGFTVEGILTNFANTTINTSGTYTLQINATDGQNTTSLTGGGVVISQEGAPTPPSAPTDVTSTIAVIVALIGIVLIIGFFSRFSDNEDLRRVLIGIAGMVAVVAVLALLVAL